MLPNLTMTYLNIPDTTQNLIINNKTTATSTETPENEDNVRSYGIISLLD